MLRLRNPRNYSKQQTCIALITLTSVAGLILFVVSQHSSRRHGLSEVSALSFSAKQKTEQKLASKDSFAFTIVAPDEAGKAQVKDDYGKLPLSFEVNEGQTDSQVKFLSRGSRSSLFLTSTEVVLALSKSTNRKVRESHLAGRRSTREQKTKQVQSVMLMELVNASPASVIKGVNKLPGESNYFIGSDPTKWHTGIPNYSKVQYKDIYPGVDLIYYGNRQQLEYDFVVAPGADPSTIQLAFKGLQRLQVDEQGDLMLGTAVGEIRQHKPIIYQDIDGKRKEVAGSYVIKNRHQVSIEIPVYDVHYPLVIDPILSYSTYLGGNNGDYCKDIAIDSSGNAYVVGSTWSTNFPTVNPTQPAYAGGNTDVFVTKLNATGTALIYSTYLGGSKVDSGEGIAVDVNGSAYVTGATNSINFPTTTGAFQRALGGDQVYVDAFVTKISSAGNGLIYSTYLGGQSEDGGYDIAVDSSGDAYITGFTSYQFPTTPNALQKSLGSTCNCTDAFMTKMNETGTALVYSTYLGGWDSDTGYRIAVDSLGNAYVTGDTKSLNFPTANAAQGTCVSCNSYSDAFVTKLNPSASGSASLVYSTFLGGNNIDYGNGIAVDSSGNIYVVGRTDSVNFPVTQSTFQTSLNGVSDTFVAKLNPAVSGIASLIYSTHLGGSNGATGRSIAVDSTGNAYVTGDTNSTNFPTTPDAFQKTIRGNVDGFVTKLNTTGAALIYSTYLGGSSGDTIYGIAVDSSGNAYVAGQTGSTNFPTTPGAFQTAYGGGAFPLSDAFIAKIGSAAPSNVNPLIFIPGIGGSRLDEKGGGNLWPEPDGNPLDKLNKLSKLSLDPNKQHYEIVVPDVIRSYSSSCSTVEVYRPLLGMLTDPARGNYREYQVSNDPARRTTSGCDLSQRPNNPNLFVFAYDWRKSGAENALALKDYVGCVRQFYPNSQVDILAHSMGGLIARRYILDNSSPRIVNKLITIGSPWLGAPKAIHTLETGQFVESNCIIGSLTEPVLDKKIKELVEFFPGEHELLPSQAYFAIGSSPFSEDGYDINKNNKPYETYDFKQLFDLINQLHPRSLPATTGSTFHDKPGQDNWQNDSSGVQYYHFYGFKSRQDTIRTVIAKPIIMCAGFACNAIPQFGIVPTLGDGTVPIISARRQPGYLAPNTTMQEFSGALDGGDALVEHTGLTRNPKVYDAILAALRSTSFLTSNSQSYIEEPLPQPSYYLEVSGALSVTITDSSGNSITPLGDGPNADVPDVISYSLGDKSVLVITPIDQAYTIKLHNDANPIAIKVTKGTSEVTTQAIRYLDLTFPQAGTAMFRLTPQGVESLRYDGNNDGIFETIITPTASISGPSAQDMDPPTVSIGESRQQTGTLVTITATDSGSGVKAVYYSLDGTQYQTYTQPFMADPYRNPTVYAFADDNVANRSGLATFKLTAPASNIQSSQSSYSVGKGDGHATITVARTGDTTGQATVNYATSDTAGLTPCGQPGTGIASSRCNYTTTVGTLRFAVGETAKTIFIPIVDSAYAEGNKSFTLTLSNPSGAALGTPSVVTITIINNNQTTGSNPIINDSFFIRQQYIDFLGREPDPPGLAGWLDVLNNCGTKFQQPCDRIEVSSGFFRSPEFQDRGYFVFRFYPVSLGRNPFYAEFMPDLAKVSGFLTDAQLEANKVAFVQEFMSRQEFQTKYGALADSAFVDALLQSCGLPNHPSKDGWKAGLANKSLNRAQVLRALIESAEVYQKFYNQSFVVMQYFGYLRRDPDILYLNWIQTMNQNGGDYRTMINGFMNSSEYFLRFGP